MARGARVCGRAVERVLAEDAERNFVGDGLADQLGAGVEQGLHRPGMPGRDRVAARPIRVAAAGRTTGDIEQVLGREAEAREGPARFSLDAKLLTRDEGTDLVGHDRYPPSNSPTALATTAFDKMTGRASPESAPRWRSVKPMQSKRIASAPRD